MSDDFLKDEEEKKSKRFEMLCGIILAIFACALALSDLGGNNCDNDSLKMYNEKSNAYQWYSSKGIKQNLVEGQRDMLKSLLDAGVVKKEHNDAIVKIINGYDKDIERYKKEKNEILQGSDKVGKNNWAQDINGELGKIIGANEYEEKALKLNEGGDIFDQSVLFLQICMILGALSLLIQHTKMKWLFLSGAVLLGAAGVFFCIKGYIFISAL